MLYGEPGPASGERADIAIAGGPLDGAGIMPGHTDPAPAETLGNPTTPAGIASRLRPAPRSYFQGWSGVRSRDLA